MINNKEFYIVKKKYLAFSLSYLGFKYFAFDNVDGTKNYSFKYTKELKEALDGLTALKNKLNK